MVRAEEPASTLGGMHQVAAIAVFGVAVVLVLGLAVVAGDRLLRRRRRGDVVSGFGDALGNYIDVFGPGQARAARELQEQDNVGAVAPSPDDDDRPVSIDLRARRMTIRRPAP